MRAKEHAPRDKFIERAHRKKVERHRQNEFDSKPLVVRRAEAEEFGAEQDAQGQDRRANTSVIDDFTANRYYTRLTPQSEPERDRMVRELREYADFREKKEERLNEEHFE